MEKIYDLIIIGSGSAGLSAGLYAGRAMLNTLIIEKKQVGGQILNTAEVVNYPGVRKASGPALTEVMYAQAKDFGVSFVTDEIKEVDFSGEIKRLVSEKEEYLCRAVIIATGAQAKKLGIPGEKEFVGRGVSYCAVCDGAFYRDKVVAVVGGGNAAVEEGCYLTKFAKKVYIIHRRDQLRADKIVQDRAFKNDKVEFIYDTIPVEIKGKDCVESFVLKNVKTNETFEIETDGVFPYIGFAPNIDYKNAQVQQNEAGFIVTNECMETSVKGVYAIGDVRTTPLRQVITAAADGAVAGCFAVKYLEEIAEKTAV